MPGLGGPYESKANVLTFLQKLKSDLTLADITDAIYNSAVEYINNKTDTYWELFTGDLYVDGRGDSAVICPVVPIGEITDLVIIELDETETELTVSGTDRQIVFDTETGVIRRIDSLTSSNVERDISGNASVFPDGEQNIKITGSFGRDAATHDSLNLLKTLHSLVIMKFLGFQYPSSFKVTDLVEEKIGEYMYRVGDMQYAQDPKNQRKTLDGFINELLDLLPKDDSLTILAV